MNRFDRIADYWMRWVRGAEIVLINDFRPPPYGGGNQFLTAVRRELISRGVAVGVNKVGRHTQAMLFNSFNFDFDQVSALRDQGIRMVHRVDGPISAYRGKDRDVDEKIWQINHDVADATVFQSEYSMKKHEEMGLNFVDPVIIPNACDSSIFYPSASREPLKGRKVKLIMSSWSDNPMKGGDVYRWLDENLDFSRYEFTYIGRTQEKFRNIEIRPPVGSHELAEVLRNHDILVFASRNDCCSNAMIESLACGLPVVYHNSGGSGELAKGAGLAFEQKEEILGLLDRLVEGYVGFADEISLLSMKDVVDRYLATMEVSA